MSRIKIALAQFFVKEAGEENLAVVKDLIARADEAGASLLTYAHDGYRYALGQRDYLNNVGYSAAPCARIELSCAREGGFAFDSMETLCQPMA